MDVFSLEVEKLNLIRALNRLSRVEKKTDRVSLSFNSSTLTISMGRSAQELAACGTWPLSVTVARKWAETLLQTPIEGAVVPLQVKDGKLRTRDFVVQCSLCQDALDDDVDRRRRIEEAVDSLDRYDVTEQDIEGLIANADPGIANLWSAEDGRLIEHIASAWKHLAFFGVEPSKIRGLVHQKSRDLWKNRSKRR